MNNRQSHRSLTILAICLLMLPAISSAANRLQHANPEVRKRLETKVSLTFKNISTSEAIKILSEQSNINVAVSSGVRGEISVFLSDVDVATALDIVTEMTGNAYFAEGDIIKVLPADEYEQLTGNKFRIDEMIGIYNLKNVSVKDAASALSSLGLVTPNGKVFSDEALGSLIIWDVAETHDRMRGFIETIDQAPAIERIVLPLNRTGSESMLEILKPHLTKGFGSAELLGTGDRIAIVDFSSRIPVLKELVTNLDVSPKQVLLEVKILQVSYSDETTVGINWEVVQENLNDLSIKSAYSVLPTTSTGNIASGSVLTVGNLDDDDFNVVMEALDSYGTTDIISLPRIVALNATEAKIHVGSSEPYVTVTTRESQGVITYHEAVTQIDVGVKLNVTPEIHPNDFITIKVRPEVSSVSRFEVTVSGNSIPVVDQSMMETTVQVKSGICVILGGLMKKELRKTSTGIPLLRSVPLIKYLFSSSSVKEVRSELVIMIRPTIVTGDHEFEVEEIE